MMFGFRSGKRKKSASSSDESAAAANAAELRRRSRERSLSSLPGVAAPPATVSVQRAHFYDGGDSGPVRPTAPADTRAWVGQSTEL